ncbi:glycoside hydrolase family 2 TIM barrel-domain containing protein [Lachnospiraceae bacterium 46-15]
MRPKQKRRWLSILLASAVVFGSFNIPVSAAPDMTAAAAEVSADAREINFNKGWKFHFLDGETENGMEQASFDDSSWEETLLPHDFNIMREQSNIYEAESGFYPGGVGWYRKSVAFPAEYEGKTLVLNFDGVYNHAYVYVNGQKLGENHYGYNDFSFDISEYVTCDGSTKNVIAVKAECTFPSSRWYSGAGIYRDVKLVVTDNVHVAKNGTYVTTPNLEAQKNGDVTVNVATTVQNDGNASVNAAIRTTVLDAEGKEVSAPVSKDVTVEGGAEASVEQQASVNKPALWSCETPNLYYVKTEVLVNNQVKDTYMTTFGFRYFNFDANTGFSLNGQNVKFKGVCMHHDQGALGAAAYRDAIYRQVEKLKEMGCNAIRTSHNTPADALLDACNELGMLVMDETFDGWAFGKNDNTQDFHTHFNQTIGSDNKILGAEAGDTWYKFVLESNIERDKNDPSVIMWDIGNELNFGVTDSSRYVEYARNMIQYIQAIDSTRPITSGDNNPGGNANVNTGDFRNHITAELANSGGLAGMNYSMGAIANVHNTHPDWKIVATETASPSNSRGIYDTTSHYGRNGDYQCTAYDTDWVSWGNSARESWWYTIKDDFVSGEFIWTGFDYIGEPTPWNGTAGGSSSGDRKPVPNSSYFGVIDTAGFPKDSFYYYTSQWREDATTLHVVPQSWNAEDLVISNDRVPVYIYSNAAKVELYLNDVLIGTSTRNPVTTGAGYEWATYSSVSNEDSLCAAVNENSQWRAMAAQFKVQYEKGTLRAVAYDAAGKVIEDTIGLDSVTSNSDQGTALKIETEKAEIQADGTSLSYISVDVVDADGRFVSAARNNIRFTLTGNGTIVGVDNGNPSTVDKFQQKSVLTSEKTANIDAFSGKALVIVRSTEESGGFKIGAVSAGLKGASVFVDTIGNNPGEVFLKDYDVTTEYTIVMGETPQLQTAVDGKMSDGSTVKGTITWEDVTEEICNTPGSHSIEGVLKIGTEEIAVTAYVQVKPIIVGVKNYSRATMAGIVPMLPETVTGFLPDGRTYGAYPVTWEALTAGQLQKVGDIVTVNGTVAVEDGKTMPVKATVRVAETITVEPRNVAPEYATLKESCGKPADKLLSITNGIKDVLNNGDERWTNWNDHLQNSSPTITFTWNEVQEISELKAWFFGDSNVTAPEQVTIAVSADGENFEEVEFTHTDYVVNQENSLRLNEAQKAKALKFTMKQVGTGYVGLTELEIWTTDSGYTTNGTAVLDTLTADGKSVEGFVPGEVKEDAYNLSEDASEFAATARDNASVNILPIDDSDMVRVIVTSEDQEVTNVYKIKLPHIPPTEEQKKELDAEVTNGETKKESDYTPESYDVFKKALEAAQAVSANPNATKRQVEKVLKKLKEAAAALVKKPVNPPVVNPPVVNPPVINPPTPEPPVTNPGENTPPQNGDKIRTSSGRYQVINAKSMTARLIEVKSKKATKMNVPATVKLKGVTYKVTEIGPNVMKGNTKLKKVILGKYVATIGKQAFMGCKNLKSVQLKGNALKNIKTGAFKKTSAKMVVSAKKMNKKQKAALLTKLKKAGMSKKGKVK